MTTRMGFGTSGVLRIETDEEDLVGMYPKGLQATYSSEGFFVLKQPPPGDKRRSKFHQYPNGIHNASVIVIGEGPEPFRIGPIEWDEGSDLTDDDPYEAHLWLPKKLRPPIGRAVVKRAEGLMRQLHPLSNYEPSSPYKELTALITQTNDYARELGVRLCVDELGLLYGRIG